ncbi:MAG: hypothetical protein ABIF11_00930 [Nitrospirota bacterium]
MINIEYQARILPDGHLSCPENIKKRLMVLNGTEFKVIINVEEKGFTPFTLVSEPEEKTGLCGVWQDDRDAEEIIKDIYSHRRGFKEVVF